MIVQNIVRPLHCYWTDHIVSKLAVLAFLFNCCAVGEWSGWDWGSMYCVAPIVCWCAGCGDWVRGAGGCLLVGSWLDCSKSGKSSLIGVFIFSPLLLYRSTLHRMMNARCMQWRRLYNNIKDIFMTMSALQCYPSSDRCSSVARLSVWLDLLRLSNQYVVHPRSSDATLVTAIVAAAE